jgi:DNA-binding NarL/FixJ family response regulator
MVRSVLEGHSQFQVCGEAENGKQGIEEATKLKPDVVILDIVMPVMNGFEAAQEIRKSLPDSAIVILSSHADRGFIEYAKKIGARGFVAKGLDGDGLLKAVEAAAIGGEFILVE